MTPSQKAKIRQATELAGRNPDVVEESKSFVAIQWKRPEWFRHSVMIFIRKRGKINRVFVDGKQQSLPHSWSWKSIVSTYN